MAHFHRRKARLIAIYFAVLLGILFPPLLLLAGYLAYREVQVYRRTRRDLATEYVARREVERIMRIRRLL